MGMFQKIGEAFRRFMYGRYGTDSLNKALLIAAVVLMLLGWAGGSWIASWMTIFNLFAYAPLIWCIFRMYSRNIDARRRENAKWMGFLSCLRDRDNRYFRCPRCHQTVRVPRGKGKINIRCPKCGERFIKKT